jgi:hypothetical protein
MENLKNTDYSEFYTSRWNTAVKQGNYPEALDSAIKGYLIAKEIGDDTHEKVFLGFLSSAVHELIDKPLEQLRHEASQGIRCSFCGREEKEVKLVAGPGVTICQGCNDSIHDIFAKEKGPE